jgi:mono/diheme cytochrome c family protein
MRKNVFAVFTLALLGVAFVSAPAVHADDKGDPAKGKDTFEQCSGCHNADSTEKKMGPGLKGLFSKEKLANGEKPTYDSVLKQVNEGGNGMPGYKDLLSDQEKKDLMAYLQTL